MRTPSMRRPRATRRSRSRLAACAVGLLVASASCGSGGGDGFRDDAGAGRETGAGSTGVFCTTADCDRDGYTAPADCDDTDGTVNPEAYDFPGDGIDNDCDGTKDNPVETCETQPAQSPGTPEDFARAADLCAQPSMTLAGTRFDPLVKAAWGSVRGYGSGQRIWVSETKERQVDIVSSFGANATRRGRTMVGLSNGPWGTRTPRSSPALDPAGFDLADACADIPLTPKDCASLSAGTPAGHGISVQDWAELTLWIKVPTNARAVAFDFAFFSTEFNQFWNAALNDAFFVLVTSAKLQGENVAKDASGLAISVNSGFFQLCPRAPGPPGLSPDKSAALAHCVGNAGDPAQNVVGTLMGTGFDGSGESPFDGTATSNDGTSRYIYGGGSGWLTAKFSVTPGESIVMRVIVHDTFDGLKDSAVLLDALRWEATSSDGVDRPTPR